MPSYNTTDSSKVKAVYGLSANVNASAMETAFPAASSLRQAGPGGGYHKHVYIRNRRPRDLSSLPSGGLTRIIDAVSC